MTEQELWEIADAADMIIAGYAFTAASTIEGDVIRVLNLNNPDSAATIYDDEIIETTMDDGELDIVRGIYARDKKYMEPLED